MRKTVLALATVSMLALSACGGGDDEQAKESISGSLTEQEEGSETFTVEEDEADCIADGMVDGVGVDQLQEYGILTDDLELNKDPDEVEMSTEDAETTTDALFDCTGVQAMMDEEMSAGMEGQPQAVKDCLDEVLTDERLRNLFVAIFSGKQEEAQAEIQGPMMECATEAMGG